MPRSTARPTTRKAEAALHAAVLEAKVLESAMRDHEGHVRAVLAYVLYAGTRGRAYAPAYFSVARLADILLRNGLVLSRDSGRSFRPTDLGALVAFSAAEMRDAKDALQDQGY